MRREKESTSRINGTVFAEGGSLPRELAERQRQTRRLTHALCEYFFYFFYFIFFVSATAWRNVLCEFDCARNEKCKLAASHISSH